MASSFPRFWGPGENCHQLWISDSIDCFSSNPDHFWVRKPACGVYAGPQFFPSAMLEIFGKKNGWNQQRKPEKKKRYPRFHWTKPPPKKKQYPFQSSRGPLPWQCDYTRNQSPYPQQLHRAPSKKYCSPGSWFPDFWYVMRYGSTLPCSIHEKSIFHVFFFSSLLLTVVPQQNNPSACYKRGLTHHDIWRTTWYRYTSCFRVKKSGDDEPMTSGSIPASSPLDVDVLHHLCKRRISLATGME